MGEIVCKFGGTSMADAQQVRKVVSIIRADPRRRLIVVSAPGKRSQSDQKITDLLYACHEAASQGQDPSGPMKAIKERFLELAGELGLGRTSARLLEEAEARIRGGASKDFVASRGEYLCARLLAEHLSATFLDTQDLIRISENGKVGEGTYVKLAEALRGPKLMVIPGFYGSDPDGEVRTFSRGGSDITGAVVARAAGAEIYENWTDVSGFLMADPRVVANPRGMREVSYRELRELSAMGAQVLHEDAIYPVSQAGIPINIRNTNDPDDPGTLVVRSRSGGKEAIAGIAGKIGLATIRVGKERIHREPALMQSLYEALKECGVEANLSLSGIDAAVIAVADSQVRGKRHVLQESLAKRLHPVQVEITENVALISVVGEGLSARPGIASRLFSALAQEQINVFLTEGGSSGLSLTIGLAEKDLEPAIRAIYESFAL
jgi:aspartate kinase